MNNGRVIVRQYRYFTAPSADIKGSSRTRLPKNKVWVKNKSEKNFTMGCKRVTLEGDARAHTRKHTHTRIHAHTSTHLHLLTHAHRTWSHLLSSHSRIKQSRHM